MISFAHSSHILPSYRHFNDTIGHISIYLALRSQIHAKREQLICLVNVLHRFRSFRVKNTNSHPKLNIIRTLHVKAC